MILKYCLNNEIHKTFAHPLTFEALLEDIKTVFKDKLPSSFSLQYQDQEGDLITISSDLEYQSMLVFDLTKSMSSIKIFISPSEEKDKLIPLPLSKTLSQESFELVSDNSSNSIIVIGTSFTQEEDTISEKDKQETLKRPEDDTNSPLEQSQSSFSESLARLEARAEALKKQIEFFAEENGLEGSVTDDRQEENRETQYYKEQNVSEILPTQYYSVEDSLLSKEIDNAVEELANRTIQRVIRKLIALNEVREKAYEKSPDESKPAFWNQFESKRREAKLVKNNAIVKIQSAFRGYRTRKVLRELLFQRSSEAFELERERRIARTREQVSQLINRALDQLDRSYHESNVTFEHETNENVDIHSTTKRNWRFDNLKPKDYRESSYDSEDDGTIYSGGIKPPVQDFDESQTNSPKKDDYIRCRLDLSSGGNSLQSPSTAKISEAYRRLRALEAIQVQEFFDYSVKDLGSPKMHLFEDMEGKRVVTRALRIDNIGTKPWRKCVLKTIGDLKGKEVEIYNVAVGETRHVTLEIAGDFKPGFYVSEWRIIHETEHGVMEFVGCPFDLAFSIKNETNESPFEAEGRQGEQDQDKTEDYFYHEEREEEIDEEQFYSPEEQLYSSQESNNLEENLEDKEEEYEDEFEDEEDDEEEDYEDEEEQEEEEDEKGENADSDRIFTRYLNYREELAKVREIRKLFPNDDLDNILEFVEKKSSLTTDELVMAYWAARKAN